MLKANFGVAGISKGIVATSDEIGSKPTMTLGGDNQDLYEASAHSDSSKNSLARYNAKMEQLIEGDNQSFFQYKGPVKALQRMSVDQLELI